MSPPSAVAAPGVWRKAQSGGEAGEEDDDWAARRHAAIWELNARPGGQDMPPGENSDDDVPETPLRKDEEEEDAEAETGPVRLGILPADTDEWWWWG